MSTAENDTATAPQAEEESTAVFEPVIRLEQKVEWSTNEEQEDVLFKM